MKSKEHATYMHIVTKSEFARYPILHLQRKLIDCKNLVLVTGQVKVNDWKHCPDVNFVVKPRHFRRLDQ